MPAAPDQFPGDPPPQGPVDQRDEAVLARLADLWTRLDPPPPSLVAGITFAVALDQLYVEVAEIQRESHRPAAAGVRGTVDVDDAELSFTTSDLAMTVLVTPRGPGRVRLDGWVTPWDGGRVALRLPGETRRHDPEHGRFWFDGVPRGHVQLVVEAADGRLRMVTPAVEV